MTKALLMAVLLLCSSLVPGLALAERYQWRVEDGGNGHFYEPVPVAWPGIHWSTSYQAAVSAGGYLATLTSAEENTFVFDLIKNRPECWVFSGGNAFGLWVGGYQPEGSPEPGGAWRWVTDEPWVFTHWGAGEPNNQGGNENVLSYIGLGGEVDDTWNDGWGEAPMGWDPASPGYIVEYVPEPATTSLLALGGLAVFLRRKRRFLAALGGMVLVVGFLAPPVKGDMVVKEFAVSTAGGSQVSPRISGDTVVWQDYRNGNWDIYARNLALDKEFPVIVAPGPQTQPAVSGNTVVWTGTGSDSAVWGIQAKNVATGVETAVSTKGLDESYPSVSGDIVAWGQLDGPSRDVYARNLSTGAFLPVSTHPRYSSLPAISGNVVTWDDARNGNSDIYAKDLLTGQEIAVCTHPADQWASDVSGSLVVWYDARNSNYDIYGLNLTTGEEFPVCTASGNQFSPSVSGVFVVWEDARGGTDRDIYGLDLLTGEEFPICTQPGDQASPRIWGNIVVWQDDRNGGWDIYGATLSEPQPIPEPTSVISGLLGLLTLAGCARFRHRVSGRGSQVACQS